MLKRSEHLRLWNKRWVSLDGTGKRVTFRVGPDDAKVSTSVLLSDIRNVSVSSVNFHGNKSYANRCVFLETKVSDPESDDSKGVFLVAETQGDASRWVADIRALAPDNASRVSDELSLSPAAAPPTPALVVNVPRRTPTSVSSVADSADSAESMTPRSISSRGVSDAPSADVSYNAPSSTTSRSSFGTSGSMLTRRAGRGSWFQTSFGKNTLAAELSNATEELTKTTTQTHAQMCEMRDMMRSTLHAKDAELHAQNENLKAEQQGSFEARQRAATLQKNLEEKSAEVSALTRELEDVRAASALAKELTRTRMSRADTTERELRQQLAQAEASIKNVEQQKHAESLESKKIASELRCDLEAAGARAIRAANEAEDLLATERAKVAVLEHEKLALERQKGWKGVFGGGGRNNSASKKSREQENARNTSGPENFSLRPSDDRDTNTTPLLSSGSGLSQGDSHGVSSEHMRNTSASASGYRGKLIAAVAAAVEASTPEAAATARRRLFEYGMVAPPTPMEVIEHLDSPGAHGCRQM